MTNRDPLADILADCIRQQARLIPANEPERPEAFRRLMEIADNIDGGERPTAKIIPFPKRATQPRRAGEEAVKMIMREDLCADCERREGCAQEPVSMGCGDGRTFGPRPTLSPTRQPGETL